MLTISFWARTAQRYTASEALPNFCFSCSSRTYALTTRIPVRFSWISAFRASYLSNISRKYFPTRPIRKAMTIPKNTSATRYTQDSLALMIKVIVMAVTSITGARISIRIIIWNAFCTLVTSVVRRVTSPAVEK